MGVKGTRLPICKHNARIMGCGRYVYALKQACPASKKTCARTVLASWMWKVFLCSEASLPGFTKKRGGWGGRSPPHVQTQCSHHGCGRYSYALKQACPASKKSGGVGGGAQPPPCANTTLASWVWKVFVCSEASLPGFTEKRGGWGGRSPPHVQTQCSHHGFGRYSYALKQACPASKKSGGGGVGGSAAPPMCKHNARIMGLEGIRMKAEGGGGWGGSPLSFSNTITAPWVWKGFVCKTAVFTKPQSWKLK